MDMDCSVLGVVNSVVTPGDLITQQCASQVGENDRIKLGPGLQHHSHDVIVTKAGILRHEKPNTFWVDSHQKRYVPSKGENVIGVVMGKVGDAYKVDIGSSDYAMLHNLSFEGASKRNKPNLLNGDIVYGRLVSANRDMEPEMSCIDPASGKANGMGQVSAAGILMTVSLNLIRKILSKDCILLPELGKCFKFEAIIGMNGKIHISSITENHIIAIMNVITASEYLTNEQIKVLLAET